MADKEAKELIKALIRIIFLDKDGVLNTRKTFNDIHFEWLETGVRRHAIDLDKVALLKEIVVATNGKIVLDATCRTGMEKVNGLLVPKTDEMIEFTEILDRYGLSIYDVTPKDYVKRQRQNEIKAWLRENGDNVESFIVIDDDSSDLKDFEGKELIKTRFWPTEEDPGGLQRCHVDEAIKKLLKRKS